MADAMQLDGNGNPYVHVDNIRISLVRRKGDKDWAGTGDYLSFRAQVDGQPNRLKMGAEIPIRGENAKRVVQAIGRLERQRNRS